MAAVGRMPKLEALALRSMLGLVNLDQVAAATSLRHFSGGYAAFDALKDLRPDLPFTSIEGQMTDEEEQRWGDWLDDQRRSGQ